MSINIKRGNFIRKSRSTTILASLYEVLYWKDSMLSHCGLIIAYGVWNLVQVMASSLMAPSHYPIQCWLSINITLRRSFQGNFCVNTQDSPTCVWNLPIWNHNWISQWVETACWSVSCWSEILPVTSVIYIWYMENIWLNNAGFML